MTAKKFVENKIGSAFDFFPNYFKKEEIFRYMNEYAELKLKEHSALKEQEVVGYLAVKGDHRVFLDLDDDIDYAKERKYTVTELVKKKSI